MAKIGKEAHSGAKHAKPAGHTGHYTPGDVEHVQLSTPTSMNDHPARQKPDPQGGGYWGDSNGMSMGVNEANSESFS